MRITRLSLVAALGAAVWAAVPVQAQTYHLPATPERGVWMEVSHADIDGVSTSFPSSTWFLSGRMPISSQWRALVDVPFAHAKASLFGEPKTSNTVLGNPFVGVEYLARNNLVVETGVRLPITTADDDSFADILAFFGDFQRGEAFLEDVLPVSAAVTYERGLGGAMSLRARGGVVGLFDTGEAENEALIDYGLMATYPAGRARLGAGFYGRWAATADAGDFFDNSVHHAALSGDFLVGGVRPGITVRVPVDSDYGDIVNSTIGLYLQVPLR